ncbi:MAG: saccharopine dehydrogenase NADP-binding domain-containing protein [Pseudomonadota bacterium]
MKTVILGGYGNFGARICRALSDSAGIELVIAGRNKDQASALAAQLKSGTGVLQLDLGQADLTQKLLGAGAELVIHTAGPFQQQGYEVPLAVAAVKAHYIDLADGRRFVCDFPAACDQAFRAAGRIAISGASTVPALSSAVVDSLTHDWRSIESIDCCIAPAQTAPRGIATLEGVMNYCGAPIQVWHDAQWITAYGWADLARIEFLRLRPRLGALCDIPDLELFPAYYRGVRSVMFRAALEIGLTQRIFAGMAALRRADILRRPERFAKFINMSAKSLDFLGSSLGGMVVRVIGIDAAGSPVQRAWHIAADHDHGPEIPAMPAILLARRLAANGITDCGAHTCISRLALSDFAPEFAKWDMVTDAVG